MTDKEMLDADFCMRKAEEYRVKAMNVREPKLKSAYEAVSREYQARVKTLKQKNA